MTHICVDNLTIIGSDNGLSPRPRQAIIWTNVGILLSEPLGTNFSELLIEIITFSVTKTHLKMSLGNWRSFCLGLNELTHYRKSTWGTRCEINLRWIPRDITDEESNLILATTWCRQSKNHYLSQCPKSALPYGDTRPQWVKQNQNFYQSTDIYTCSYLQHPCTQVP